jgi:hypothetical protein
MDRRFGSFDEGCLRGYNQEPLLPRRLKVEVDGALLADLQFHILRFNLGERSGFDDDVVNTRREVIESIESVLRCLGGADYICFHVSSRDRPTGYRRALRIECPPSKSRESRALAECARLCGNSIENFRIAVILNGGKR